MKQADYSALIDAETWAFIEKTLSLYPEDSARLDVNAQRESYDAMWEAFRHARPSSVEAVDRSLDGVPCRIYQSERTDSPLATLVYFHGGAFALGGLDSHDDVCAEICDAAPCRVVSVDYRLAPEHQHPAAFEDCVNASRQAREIFGLPLVLAGDSAGANLAAAVAHATRNEGLEILGQILIYPSLRDEIPSEGSYAFHANAPLLSRDDLETYGDLRFFPRDEDRRGDPTAAPLADEDFSGLPPTFVIIAECDPIADDGPDYVAEIRKAGGIAECVIAEGMVHGFLRARWMSKRARRAFDRILEAADSFARGELPESVKKETERISSSEES